MNEGLRVFAAEEVKKRLMDDDGLVASVLTVFKENMPEQIDALAEYCAASDFNAVARQAHSIKGACANVGAEVMAALAQQSETAAKQGQIAELLRLLAELRAGQDALFTVIDSYVAQKIR